MRKLLEDVEYRKIVPSSRIKESVVGYYSCITGIVLAITVSVVIVVVVPDTAPPGQGAWFAGVLYCNALVVSVLSYLASSLAPPREFQALGRFISRLDGLLVIVLSVAIALCVGMALMLLGLSLCFYAHSCFPTRNNEHEVQWLAVGVALMFAGASNLLVKALEAWSIPMLSIRRFSFRARTAYRVLLWLALSTLVLIVVTAVAMLSGFAPVFDRRVEPPGVTPVVALGFSIFVSLMSILNARSQAFADDRRLLHGHLVELSADLRAALERTRSARAGILRRVRPPNLESATSRLRSMDVDFRQWFSGGRCVRKVGVDSLLLDYFASLEALLSGAKVSDSTLPRVAYLMGEIHKCHPNRELLLSAAAEFNDEMTAIFLKQRPVRKSGQN